MKKIKFGFILLLTLMTGVIPVYATNTEVEIVESLEEHWKRLFMMNLLANI